MFTRNTDGSYQLTAKELYGLIGTLDLTQLATDAGVIVTPPTTPPPVTTPPTTTTGAFGGIYAFSGGVNSLINQPSVSGCVVKFAWSDVETTPGVRDWSKIDAIVNQWHMAGKGVILRVMTAGGNGWDTFNPSNKSFTPLWIYANGVKSVKTADGTLAPQYWHKNYLSAYQSFVAAFAAKYDGNPAVVAVECGVGYGGETCPDTNKKDNVSLWTSVGYTDDLWFTTIQSILKIYTTTFTHTPLVVLPNNSFLGSTPGFGMEKVLQYVASIGLALQDDGLTATTVLKSTAWNAANFIVSEQRDQLAQTPGTTITQLIHTALGYHARYILLFTTDIAAHLAEVESAIVPTPAEAHTHHVSRLHHP